MAGGAALIFLLAFAVYWPALRGQFVWDDLLLVDKNPLVKGEVGLLSIWLHADFPLTTLAFWLQWLVWGKNPAGYHIVNVLLHALDAVLVWRVLARLRIPGAWIAGMIFAVHPVCAASVAWISELKNTLSLGFFLLSLWFYQKFGQTVETNVNAGASGSAEEPEPTPDASSCPPPPRFAAVAPKLEAKAEQRSGMDQSVDHANLWYCLSLAAFLLSLLSKTSTVMLPVVLLASAWWHHGRITRQVLLRTIPFFVLALLFGLMTVWFQAHQVMQGETVQTENFFGRLAGAGWALWFYLDKALLPLNLNMIYPRRTIDATALPAYLPLLLWVGGLSVCWWLRRSWGRAALFGLGVFAVTLFPVLGFFDMYFLALSRVSDHFQYLPLIAVIALVAAGLRWLLPARVLPFVVATLLLGSAALTVERARVLASDETLWRDTLAKNPAAWTAHNNLGCILAEQHQMDDAIGHFQASLQYNPRNAQAHVNLARALALQGRFGEAETHFQAALKIKPRDADAHKSYAAALQQRGRIEEALAHLREALAAQPDVETRLQLATLLHATKQTREAVAQYREVLSFKPDSVEALNNLAWLLATSSEDALRDGAQAVRLAERACRLTQYKEAAQLGTLAAAYAEAGQFADAAATAEKAREVATAAGNTRFAEINQQLLALYRAGKAYHEPRQTGR
jgi:tetratricopeptide (TPR) repeat protein